MLLLYLAKRSHELKIKGTEELSFGFSADCRRFPMKKEIVGAYYFNILILRLNRPK